jgi:hypothetical protein
VHWACFCGGLCVRCEMEYHYFGRRVSGSDWSWSCYCADWPVHGPRPGSPSFGRFAQTTGGGAVVGAGIYSKCLINIL